MQAGSTDVTSPALRFSRQARTALAAAPPILLISYYLHSKYFSCCCSIFGQEEVKRRRHQINIYFASLQLLSFLKICRIHLSLIYLWRLLLCNRLVVVTHTHTFYSWIVLEMPIFSRKIASSRGKYGNTTTKVNLWKFLLLCGFAGLREMTEERKVWPTVYFILKVTFPVHHFKDLKNRLKNILKKR